MFLYGLPQLPIQDKWTLITLMGLCWDRSQTGKSLEELEGPYKYSLRELSNLTGVDHTSLRSKQGKNPREGVLDRLERFGYLSVCEGRPIDEYTGTPGRSQTYLYIHLRRIWEENKSFADAWRVPENRLIREELIEFTVGVVNSNVGSNNSNVDNANSNVDEDNHSVDGASTKYVLRQCNTKKTMEDKRKILASGDATPSLSQEELMKKVMDYLIQKGKITFYELEKFLSPYREAVGNQFIRFTISENAIVWENISSDYYSVFSELMKRQDVQLTACSTSRYKNGRKLKLPIGEALVNHDEKHWYPRLIEYTGDTSF